ncbi:MAG: alanine dehydrogenase [Actinobacteria bacterium]|nr:alanine dehydrogenase [Actinomycetota bacterium]
MIIGIPKEIKDNEYRVAITPAGVEEFVKHKHRVIIESGAGIGSGIADQDYIDAGAEILNKAKEIWSEAEFILKVKEPLKSEYSLMRKNQIIFTFLHLASEKELAEALILKKVVAIAYETIQFRDKSLPLLIPMSQIAGRMSIQIGAHLLEKMSGGRGLLLGGVPGVAPADVVIIGAGNVGVNAARIAIGMGASVTILNQGVTRLSHIDNIFSNRIKTRVSNRYNIEKSVLQADLIIGAVLVPGTKTPFLVTEEMVKRMKKGSVIIDVSIDQGGCVETSRPTTHSEPTFVKYDVVHYGVTNIPGIAPFTATWALTNVTLPFALRIANHGLESAIIESEAIRQGINIIDGKVVYKPVAKAHKLEYVSISELVE